jgi:hypothetical protein
MQSTNMSLKTIRDVESVWNEQKMGQLSPVLVSIRPMKFVLTIFGMLNVFGVAQKLGHGVLESLALAWSRRNPKAMWAPYASALPSKPPNPWAAPKGRWPALAQAAGGAP